MNINRNLKRYIIVGGTAYVIELSALFLLHKIAGLSSLKSVAISFWIGLIVAFVMQKLITFENYDTQPHILLRQIIGFGLLITWNYAFSLLLVKLLESVLSVFIIRTIAILVVTVWNFAVYKVLFKKSKSKPNGQNIKENQD